MYWHTHTSVYGCCALILRMYKYCVIICEQSVTTPMYNVGCSDTWCCWEWAEQILIEEAGKTVWSTGEAVQWISEDTQHASARQTQPVDASVVLWLHGTVPSSWSYLISCWQYCTIYLGHMILRFMFGQGQQ